MSTETRFPHTTLTFQSVEARRGDRPLFSGLDFTLQSGDVLWVQGDNGIGKTTLLRLAAGLARPQVGDVSYTRQSKPVSAFECTAYQGHKDAFKPQLTAREALQFWARLYEYKGALDSVFARVDLADRQPVPVGQLSAGQKRRLAFARLWVSQKSIWIMDEPGAAMDISGVALIERLITAHSQRGGSVILASHSAAKSLAATSRRLTLHAA